MIPWPANISGEMIHMTSFILTHHSLHRKSIYSSSVVPSSVSQNRAAAIHPLQLNLPYINSEMLKLRHCQL